MPIPIILAVVFGGAAVGVVSEMLSRCGSCSHRKQLEKEAQERVNQFKELMESIEMDD